MNKKRILLWGGLGLGLAVLGLGLFAIFSIGPRNVIGILRYDTRQQGALRVGDRAPDVELLVPQELAADAPRVHLRDRMQGKPLVLIFGSFT